MLANTPAMLEAHYAIPMTERCCIPSIRGSILRSLPSCSTTQTPSSSSSTLEFALIIKEALAETEVEPTIINYRDLECGVEGMR